MTAKEALEKLTNYGCSKMSEKIECKEIIETALNRLGELDLRVKENNLLIDTLQKVIKKLEQVSKLIEKKEVDFYLFHESKDYEEYNIHLIETTWKSDYQRRKLTYTDFELLKEVLK